MIKVSARLFPIGFIISVDAPNFDPHDFYIDGNWERIKGRVIVGVDEAQTEFNVTGKIGGAKTHTLTLAQIPKIQPELSVAGGGSRTTSAISYTPVSNGRWYAGADDMVKSFGGGQAHNNLQPYQTAYVWKLISYSN